MARDLYISTLFRKNLQYAVRLRPDQIFIFSAKYGLVGLDDEIEPYDMTLNTMSGQENREWAKRVLVRLSDKADLKQDQFALLVGAKYRKHLIPHMAQAEVSLEGQRIGEQLHQLSELRDEA